jgi:transcription-repair coupling factor (superfamily II helicase)
LNLAQLKSIYSESHNTNQIGEALKQKNARIHLKGLAGSIDSLIAAGVSTVLNGNYLYVLRDKEEAAYFYNNLENITQDDKGLSLLFYPASYKRPYQIEAIDNANVIQRTEVLTTIRKKRKNILLVTYPEAIIENVVTQKEFDKNTLQLEVGVEYEIDFINELLIEHDFEKVDYVFEPGQFAVRGDIVDIYSFSNDLPYRLEFFGDDLESIRVFNPEDQLSINTLKKVAIVPNVNKKMLEESRTSFLTYIPKDTKIWVKDFDYAKDKILKGFDKANYTYNQLEGTVKRLSPLQLYLAPVDFENQLSEHPLVEFGERFHFDANLTIDYNVAPQPPFNKNFDLLIETLNRNTENNFINIIASENSNQLERLSRIFADIGQEVNYSPIQIALHEGFTDKELKIACYTDHQIFERYHRFKLKEGYKKSKQAFTLKEVYNLQKGDFVVHIDHGVGEFSGLEKIDNHGKMQEAIRLVYKGGDILYVSIHSLHRISKFSGKDGNQPTLNKLGSPAWAAAKKKAKSRIKEMAFDLIQLYAKRKASKGFAFAPDSYLQNELEASFIYEDTPDQLATTIAVKEDMESESPMDRLVCGDVGFGKTEIAIRAAFKAVTDGKQVAILVPTTVLAYQHYKTFTERLNDFPCTVDYVNRFKSAGKNKETLKNLAEGKVDVIIGTHRLAGKDVKFKDLGLLVIDEEQKFGVSVKDKLKLLKNNVDTLTLTATPIPRTLQFSMMNARDLSVINTPPPDRFPIDTIVQSFSETTVRDAISYETQRGGQVYFIHNRVQNIKEVAGMIQRLCPDVRVAIGHGQMEGKQLEAIIMDFMAGMYDVLVATTIVESGIDISNANTIIINNANHFGLSDLHQLRGRVGRSNKKAFAYLFTPPPQHLTDDARKRLAAIEQFSDLGSGINIAMRDLDIRGAGDLLGANQSGFIGDIGFDTFQKILDEAIKELKETEFKETFKDELANQDFVTDCQLETDMQLVIPDDYVNEVNERLSLYKELDDSTDEESLTLFTKNLKDRFGDIPEETEELMNAVRLRWLAKEVGFTKLIIKNKIMLGSFLTDQQSSYFQSDKFTKVLNYIQHNVKNASIAEKNGKLRMRFNGVKSIEQARNILAKILEKAP